MSRSTEFVNMLSRNFGQGYGLGSDMRKRQGEADLAAFNVDDYTIPSEESAAPAAPVEGAVTDPAQVEANVAFAEGGDPGKVDALLKVDAEQGAIDESADFGTPPVDRAVRLQKDVPIVNVVDWEAAKKAKADAYARAGMSDKAAQIDQEFADLKQRRFQSYASRALQVLDSDPAKAAHLLSMASQYTADGTTSQFLPTPGGQLMEMEVDEMTGEPLGKGTPIDKEALRKFVLMNADPQKFLYSQMDRELRSEEKRQEQENWQKKFEQSENQFREKLDEQASQWGHEMDYKYTALDQRAAADAAKLAADQAKDTGYTQQQWDKKVESLNKYITDIGDPMKFRNEFGEDYNFQMDEDGMPVPPDFLELRTGAEAIMSGNGHNQNMSPQVATEIFLTMQEPAKAKSRMDTDKGTGRPIIQGKDGVWYYLPGQGAAGPTPTQ